MSISAEQAAVVALLRRTGLDAPRIAERLERDGGLCTLAEDLGAGISLLPEDPEPLLTDARRAIARWRDAGLRLLTILDDVYPAVLRTVHDRPALLFVAGDPELVGRPAGVAIVGSRRASDHGLARARRFSAELVAAGHTVVSGLAAGIDTAAHRAAIQGGGRTIAVIGNGHEHGYPPGNVALQQQLARDHAVVSALWPETPPSAERFRRRNGLMSGLSLGTVIIEASQRSGTRVQARLALGHGRPVFLVGSLLTQPWAVELARRPGVHVVDSAAEVVAILARNASGLG